MNKTLPPQLLKITGFAIVENVFDEVEIEAMLQLISEKYPPAQSHFALRCLLLTIPTLQEKLWNDKFISLLHSFSPDYQLVRAIYFDKPPSSNWVVNWHQDLTLNLKEKREVEGFRHWLPKENYYSVQPPQKYLDNLLTFRIHLDDCTAQNGALRVIPESHREIRQMKSLPSSYWEKAEVCEVKKGGIFMMKPLLWHSSKRTENQQSRRVIHLEFSSLKLPDKLTFYERSK
ncbi:MAG: phytanoyl-CoA dioxygenase family protein [Bacteroidia bacterium]